MGEEIPAKRKKRQDKRPFIVLVDRSSVLAKYEEHFLDRFQKTFPDESFVPLNKRRHHSLDEDYKRLEKDSPDIQEKGFFLEIPPIEGAIQALKKMAEMDNVKVFICTGNLTKTKGVYHSCGETLQWIEDHLGHEWTQRVITTKDKTLVKGDLLIDDKPNIQGSCMPSWKHILFSAPHNRHLTEEDANADARLENWKDDSTWRTLIEHYMNETKK